MGFHTGGAGQEFTCVKAWEVTVLCGHSPQFVEQWAE